MKALAITVATYLASSTIFLWLVVADADGRWIEGVFAFMCAALIVTVAVVFMCDAKERQ